MNIKNETLKYTHIKKCAFTTKPQFVLLPAGGGFEDNGQQLEVSHAAWTLAHTTAVEVYATLCFVTP